MAVLVPGWQQTRSSRRLTETRQPSSPRPLCFDSLYVSLSLSLYIFSLLLDFLCFAARIPSVSCGLSFSLSLFFFFRHLARSPSRRLSSLSLSSLSPPPFSLFWLILGLFREIDLWVRSDSPS